MSVCMCRGREDCSFLPFVLKFRHKESLSLSVSLCTFSLSHYYINCTFLCLTDYIEWLGGCPGGWTASCCRGERCWFAACRHGWVVDHVRVFWAVTASRVPSEQEIRSERASLLAGQGQNKAGGSFWEQHREIMMAKQPTVGQLISAQTELKGFVIFGEVLLLVLPPSQRCLGKAQDETFLLLLHLSCGTLFQEQLDLSRVSWLGR